MGDPAEWGSSEEFDRRFADTHDLVRQGAALVGRDRRWAMGDRNPIQTWTRGRVTLLGDAAHPMAQYLAQGGCQALEGALCVAERVERGADVEAAFKQYEINRVPRTSRVQTWARNMGEIVHASGVPAALRNELLHLRSGKDFSQVDWLYMPQSTIVDA